MREPSREDGFSVGCRAPRSPVGARAGGVGLRPSHRERAGTRAASKSRGALVGERPTRAPAPIGPSTIPDDGEARTSGPALDGAVQLAASPFDDDQPNRLVGSLVAGCLHRGRRGSRDEPSTELLDVAHAQGRGGLVKSMGDLAHSIPRVGDEAAEHPGLVIERDHPAVEGLELSPEKDTHAGSTAVIRPSRRSSAQPPPSRPSRGPRLRRALRRPTEADDESNADDYEHRGQGNLPRHALEIPEK
jgi:hypothetical protein